MQEEDKKAVSVPRFAELVGLSRDKAYEVANSGRIRVVREGGRIIVPVAEIDRYLDQNAAATRKP